MKIQTLYDFEGLCVSFNLLVAGGNKKVTHKFKFVC